MLLFILAHLSDPHLPTPKWVPLRALANKRFLGFINWQFRRSHVHRSHILSRVVSDMQSLQPDHVVVTGDLVNVSLAKEFRRAAKWLHNLGKADWVTVVPGNHDAYVPMAYAQSWKHWASYMVGDDHVYSDLSFPFVRRRDDVAFIGLSSAITTGPRLAYGCLGDEQLKALRCLLTNLAQEGLFRVILLHHPPFEKQIPLAKNLRDLSKFRDVIADLGAELILHGHNHRYEFNPLDGPTGPVPIFGAPSSSVAHGFGMDAAQYLIYSIERVDGAWRLECRRRFLSHRSKQFAEEKMQSLVLSRPGNQPAQSCALNSVEP